MPSDRSRTADRLRSGYVAPVAQQGRVILDRDFNALQSLTSARIAADALEFVGPCGTPDDGFRISLPEANQSPPNFWSAPESPPATPVAEYGSRRDFLISPGTMYLGGERIYFPGTQHGKSVTYSYFDQPDWPAPTPPFSNYPRELVYLDVTEQEVSAVEDPDLLEVALGGPDTTQRLKLLRRVQRLEAPAANCAAAWDIARREWLAQGLEFDPATMQLLPAVRLKVGFTNEVSTSNPCDPVATGGYLYADNQLIRVRVVGAGPAQTLVWGYDNASFIYRITGAPNSTTLTLASDPPDDFHVPQQGQVVEILTTAAVLGREPDESDPTGQSFILPVAAEANGTFFSLAQPYGPPTQGATTNSLVLSPGLPTTLQNEIQSGTLPCFVRIWQAQVPLQPLGQPTTLQDPTTGISTGITVTLSGAATVANGAFWLIAARPATPQGVYPEDLLTAPQPPDGPRHWVCPLAVIDWEVRTGSNVSDCRSVFDGLVALTKRKPGCCTVRITADQVTSTAPLQSFINSAAAQAEKVTVCLSGGTYSLPMPLRLDARHAGMTFESCGGSAALRADPAALKTLFIDGLLVLTGVQGVTLRGLTLSPPLVDAPASATTNGSRTGVGVRALDAQNLTLEQCTIVFVPDSDTKADLFGACISLQGNCSGLAVQHCQLSSTIAPTFTPRAIGATGAVPAAPTTVVARAVAAPPTAPGPSTSIDVDLSHVFPPLPASSPPRRIEALLADRASAALAVLTKDRQVSPPPAGTGRFIVTVGVLAVGYVDATSPSTTLACALGAATLRDTTFTGLTFATWLSAAATSLRLQDNRVTQGIAGLWLEQPGAGYFTPITNTDGQYLPIVDFDEFLLLLLVSTIATPPTPSFPVTAAAGSNIPPAAVAEKVTTQTNFTLFLSGNQVELGSAARGNSAAKNSSAALFCALYTGAEVEDPPELAVLISANHLRSVSEFATALLTLPADQPCAITGNVIVNQGPRILERELGEIVFRPGEAPPSLWVVLPQSADSTALSVIGNVLQGPSDLSLIPRVVASTRVGLSPYNADPN